MVREAVPGDDPRHDLTQPPPSLRGQMGPERRPWPRRRALGWSRAAVHRWGGV
jgi:hypothetical protein